MSWSRTVPPDVSVIIPSFRSQRTIERTVRSVVEQDFDGKMEIIVADSSDDGSERFIRERLPEVRLTHSDRRLYPGAARNLGVENSRGPVLAFLDSDAIAQSDWLRVLNAGLDRDPQVRMISGAVINDNPELSASRILYWLEFSEFMPGHSAGFRAIIPSCNFLIRREEYLRAGGFDSEYGMSEDLVFCRRVGGGIYFEPATGARHRHRDDWTAVRLHLKRLGYWSGRFRARNDNVASWLKHVPLLAFALVPLRTGRIVVRTLRAGELSVGSALHELPRLVWGTTVWASGFYSGIRGDPEEPRG
jgi:glycosyltransferase involved in cell wall biosynthesis